MQEDKIQIKKNIAPILEKEALKKSHWFEKISYVSLLASIFLLPLFFIPSKFVIFDFSKILIIITGISISMIFWSLSTIKNGRFEFPSNLFLSSALLVVIIYLLSSIFAGNKINSFIGQGFELGTFSSVFAGFALMFLSFHFFRTKDKIFYSYIALLISFIFIFAFQALRIMFGSNFLPLGIFNDVTFSMIGKWNDLGIYFGLIAILSIATIKLAQINKTMRLFFYFSSFASLFIISLVNFKVVWFAIGSLALLFVIYSIYSKTDKVGDTEGSSRKIIKMPFFILFFLIASIVFIVDGYGMKHVIGNSISSYFKINQLEVRPSFQGTSKILKTQLKENPILGSGPNSFLNNWLLSKPEEVNNSIFWNFNFSYGVGTILTFTATTGILGIISWVLFLGLLVYTGFKHIFIKIDDQFSRYLIISSFLGSLYLWVVNVFYVPGVLIFFLTFFFTGLFIGTLINENLIPMKTLVYSGNPRRSLIFVPLLAIIIICSITGEYIYSKRFFSYFYFQKSLNSLNAIGNLDEAEKYAAKAIHFSKIDSNYRLLSDIYLARLAVLSQQKDLSKEILNSQFQSIFQNAVKNSKAAIDYDSENYQNYISLGRVYEFVMPIEGAYDIASGNYNKALKYNPKSPLINLLLARLEASNKNNVKAREYITKSLQLKNNYTDAVFFLAQIEIAEGNIKNAIKLVEAGSTLSFDNPVIFFQLGILKYSDKEKDYKGAAEAFEKALALNSSYSNARYFLGLSYYNLGKSVDAIKQFEAVQSLNPDNKEVELILKNLREGRAPFTNASPPIDDQPEKRKSLPVKEDEPKETKRR